MAIRECLCLDAYTGVGQANSQVNTWAYLQNTSPADFVPAYTPWSWDLFEGWSSSATFSWSGRYLARKYLTRAFITIDTTNLPADANITTIRFKTAGYTYRSGGAEDDVKQYLVEGNHDIPISINDNWPDISTQDVKGPLVDSGGSGESGYESPYYELGATPRTWINKGTNTKLGIRMPYDINDESPTTSESWAQYGISNRQNSVNYAMVSAPTEGATDSTSTNVSGTVYGGYAMLLEITYTSATEAADAPRPRYRFEYKRNVVDNYTACAWQYGKVHEDTITQEITGLTPNRWYHVRITSENENELEYNTANITVVTDGASAPVTSSEKELNLPPRPSQFNLQPREYDLTLKKRYFDLTLQEREDELNLKKRYSDLTLKD